MANISIGSDYRNNENFIKKNKLKMYSKGKDKINVECGYEVIYLGYSLYHKLTGCKMRSTILAPTTMLTEKGGRNKTDHKDARNIALCLSNDVFHSVYIPTTEDNTVKECIRMRDGYSSVTPVTGHTRLEFV